MASPAAFPPSAASQALFNVQAMQQQDPREAALAAGRARGEAAKQHAREAAIDFESVFLSTMFQQMFSGLKTEAPFGGGYGEEVFRDMLAEEYAKDVSRNGGIGLADHVYREILALQEGQNS
jgi:Rod binding domain-containing protein